jgi:hypothetical protein
MGESVNEDKGTQDKEETYYGAYRRRDPFPNFEHENMLMVVTRGRRCPQGPGPWPVLVVDL